MNIVQIACLAFQPEENCMKSGNDKENPIFLKYKFPGKVAKNRLVAQSMEINSATAGGGVGPETIERYQQLSRGEWGIVFVEAISITGEYLARKNGLVINRENLDGFKRLVDAFKKIDDKSILMFQITHSGRKSGDFSNRIKAYDDDEKIPVITEGGLNEIRDLFLESAVLAQEAGADGVDIKACHGYLLGEFFRPLNSRVDGYGGTVEERGRFLAAIISSIISSIKVKFADFIVGTRISLYEGIRGGCGTNGPDEVIEDLGDILKVLSVIADAGVDFFNVSAGIPTVTPNLTRPSEDSIFNLYHHFRYAKSVKDAFPDVATIGSAYSVGMGDAINFAKENVGKGYTDFAGFGRQNLADPLFPKKLMDAPHSKDSIDYCLLCGGCSGLLRKQKKVYCIKYGKKMT
jgi:2,4-dienoyl-CoA reductase-like NADH-dependent reductase (Old Yellow Enzyme family)